MDYEKAYKEALERAKSLICEEGLTEGSYPNRNACEAIFPELVESEDERIRKEILDFIQLCLSRTDFGSRSIALRKEDAEMFKKWIAYLEKQEDCFIVPKSHFEPVGEPGVDGMKILEKQKINTEGDFGRGYDCGYECCLNSHGAEWFEKQKEQDKCPEYCVMSNCVDCPIYEKQKEQKPAEWSEEDEKMLNATLSFFPLLKGLAEGNMILGREGDQVKVIDECCAWLKSLRTQPHWKPSEEQLDALNILLCRGDFSYVGQAQKLQELYIELKKL